jgi:hypothetical protein
MNAKTTFKSLAVGESFRFESDFSMHHSGMKTGVCRKLSARRYMYVEDGMQCKVGSISVEVIRVNERDE